VARAARRKDPPDRPLRDVTPEPKDYKKLAADILERFEEFVDNVGTVRAKLAMDDRKLTQQSARVMLDALVEWAKPDIEDIWYSELREIAPEA
jgi:hypothetical protein